MEPKFTYAQLRARIRIGESDLDIDAALVENSDLYFHASREHAYAMAEVHAIDLEVKELEARLSEKLRLSIQNKITDKAIEMKVRLNTDIQKLRREHLQAKRLADLWSAQKEAFDKRASALRELVKWRIQQWHQNNLDAAGRVGRTELAEYNRQRAGELRRELTKAGKRDG